MTEPPTPHRYNKIYCNNCGKDGHIFVHCKLPIISYGMVTFRINPLTGKPEYCMICRKDSLGYTDFIRGKYLANKDNIMNLLKQMTTREKLRIRDKDFNHLWTELWKYTGLTPQSSNISPFQVDEQVAKDKFQAMKAEWLRQCIDESIEIHPTWIEPEWGFPKGRREVKENDYCCAKREFSEETGYPENLLKNVQNIHPFEEIFMGSNYRSYKHKYFLTYMDYRASASYPNSFQRSEVSDLKWKTLEDCLVSIRPYNIEKRRLIINIDECIRTYLLCDFV
jgi:8-oxo-dGTP pyrophosphatase MutT (NUDIX family)